ncbi:hypothetical protein, partial [Catenulispora pinisilvae]|uniref:hypothetical protein n=1 Tax=Catenulispora pinisilvae TaxID=2705253 RepID=UPI001E302CCF
MSVQRGDLVAGRYRAEEPLGPAWRARDESGGAEVVLVPVTIPEDDEPGTAAGPGAATEPGAVTEPG